MWEDQMGTIYIYGNAYTIIVSNSERMQTKI